MISQVALDIQSYGIPEENLFFEVRPDPRKPYRIDLVAVLDERNILIFESKWRSKNKKKHLTRNLKDAMSQLRRYKQLLSSHLPPPEESIIPLYASKVSGSKIHYNPPLNWVMCSIFENYDVEPSPHEIIQL